VLASLSTREEFSATELEVYARCPFRWFYERAVRPGGLDVSFDSLGRGDLAHRAIASFYSGLEAGLGVRRVTPETLGPALSRMEEAFDAALADSRTPGRRSLAEEDDVLRTRGWVRDLVESDQHFLPGFTPAHSEFRFGPAGPATGTGPEVPALDLGGFRLKGIVDRIDEGESGLVVIDYKTGHTPTLARFGAEKVLQVPLYAAAVQTLLARPVVAGLYRGLRSGKARGFWRADVVESPGLTSTDKVGGPDEVASIIESAVGTARDAVAGIRAGAIPVAPASDEACAYCAASPFCGRGA
jgi:ATP-dependent helicase/DNAse subunit B